MAKITTPRPVRGTQDIFGDFERRFTHVAETFERVRRLYCFNRVEVPVFESTAVFARSLGETTDVVSKEMYSFEDRGGDSLTLRPEFTAGIARAFLTEGWQQHAPLKLATHGAVFRYERPQKGRYRQFHQIDAEVIGAAEPMADVELLAMADQLLKELGISDGVTLQLNTLGDAETRDAWRTALVEHFMGHRGELSEDSLKRLDKNPMRILDSKDEGDKAIVANAPTIAEHLTPEAAAFYEAVKKHLNRFGVPWRENPRIVRGLDYYSHTAFEFVTDRLGAQGTVMAGGRYNGLVEEMGGPPTPSVGWAAGIERLSMLLEEPPAADRPVAVVPMGAEAEDAALDMVQALRLSGVSTDIAYKGNFKKRLERANKLNAIAAVIIGESELEEGMVVVKNLDAGSQVRVPADAVMVALAEMGVEGAVFGELMDDMGEGDEEE